MADVTKTKSWKKEQDRLAKFRQNAEGFGNVYKNAAGAEDLNKIIQSIGRTQVKDQEQMLADELAGKNPTRGYDYERERKDLANQVFQRNLRLYQYDPSKFEYGPAAEAAFTNYDVTNSNQSREDQRSLVQALQDRMAGKAPSVAEQQLRAGQDQAVANIYGQVAGARGSNPALLARGAQMAAANSLAGTNQAAALLRAQETAQAEQSLGSVLSNLRQQDLAQSQNAAALEQQTRLANLQALIEARSRQQQGRMGLEGLKGQDVFGLNQTLAAENAAKAERKDWWKKALVGGGLSALGSIGAAFAGSSGK